MVRRYLAALLLLATPALAAVELDGDSNGAIDVAKGGTNATTAAGARTALGVQPLDSDLTSIAGLATTAWGRGLLDDADAAAGRTSLGIAPADTLNVAGVDLGTGSTTTGLLRFYGNTKAFSFGIFSQGADGLGVGWRLPSTIPTATSLLTVDSSGYMAYLNPSAVSVTASGFDGNLATTDNTLQKVAQKVDDLVISGAGDDLGSAAYTDVVALWTTCTGYLKSDGTCDTPSGSATYPSAAGVANWGGSAWGTSYTVGTAANNLVQLNGSAQLPAVSGALLTNLDYDNINNAPSTEELTSSSLATITGLAGNSKYWGTNASGTVGVYDSVVIGSGGAQAYDVDLTTWAGVTPGAGVATSLGNAVDTSGGVLTTAAIDDSPDNGSTTTAPSSNWAYDHEADTTTHGVSSGAILGGALGSTDNQLLRSDGTGGATAQGTGITVDDSNNVTVPGNISSNGLVTGLMPTKVLTSPSGTHDGSSDVATLSDSGESFTTNAYVGMTVYNITDGSSCTVTANDGTTMTCTLTGGSENDWDASDSWQVGPGPYQSGSWLYVTGAGTIRHPSTAGYQVCYESDAAAVLTVDMASSSMIFQGVLDSAVTALDAGDSIDSSGSTTGDFQCIHNKSATEAQGKGKRGTWVDGGES